MFNLFLSKYTLFKCLVYLSFVLGCIAFASWSFSTQSTLSTVCVCIISLLSIITGKFY